MDGALFIVEQISNVLPPFFDVGFSVIAFASAITAVTNTPRDDEFVGKAYKILEVLALNFGKAKQQPPNQTGGRFVAE
jgi:hypothetical protein